MSARVIERSDGVVWRRVGGAVLVDSTATGPARLEGAAAGVFALLDAPLSGVEIVERARTAGGEAPAPIDRLVAEAVDELRAAGLVRDAAP